MRRKRELNSNAAANALILNKVCLTLRSRALHGAEHREIVRA